MVAKSMKPMKGSENPPEAGSAMGAPHTFFSYNKWMASLTLSPVSNANTSHTFDNRNHFRNGMFKSDPSTNKARQKHKWKRKKEWSIVIVPSEFLMPGIPLMGMRLRKRWRAVPESICWVLSFFSTTPVSGLSITSFICFKLMFFLSLILIGTNFSSSI